MTRLGSLLDNSMGFCPWPFSGHFGRRAVAVSTHFRNPRQRPLGGLVFDTFRYHHLGISAVAMTGCVGLVAGAIELLIGGP